MAPKNQNVYTKFTLTFAIVLAIFLAFALQAQARENTPSLSNFIASVKDGNARMVRGVYIQDTLADPIVQQPSGQAGYVSKDSRVLTQFNMAAEAGNVGLLAHNYLAGENFTKLAVGQAVNLIYGDGRVEVFIITHIVRYQALDPYSATSNFRDLDGEVTISAQELFGLVYRGDRHVTFQTCIAANGNASWGRLFIIAEQEAVVNASQSINYEPH